MFSPDHEQGLLHVERGLLIHGTSMPSAHCVLLLAAIQLGNPETSQVAVNASGSVRKLRAWVFSLCGLEALCQFEETLPHQ